MLKVLATLDGSAVSEAIVPVLEKLAETKELSIELITVMDLPSGIARSDVGRAGDRPGAGAFDAPAVSQAYMLRPREPQYVSDRGQEIAAAEAEGLNLLERVAEPLRKHGATVHTDVLFAEDHAQAIIEVARDREVDMIAMATHGRSGLSRLVQGSVAGAVVSSGVAPVILVRPK